MTIDEKLANIKNRMIASGGVEKPAAHTLEPELRSPTKYTFNPVLVARITSVPGESAEQ
jgi:hypothetical protein